MKVGLQIDSKSVRALNLRLNEVAGLVLDTGKETITSETMRVFNKAQERTPVWTGATKASARLRINSDKDRGLIEGTISYSTPYAAERHEETKGTLGDKWLELTMLEESSEVENKLKESYTTLFEEG